MWKPLATCAWLLTLTGASLGGSGNNPPPEPEALVRMQTQDGKPWASIAAGFSTDGSRLSMATGVGPTKEVAESRARASCSRNASVPTTCQTERAFDTGCLFAVTGRQNDGRDRYWTAATYEEAYQNCLTWAARYGARCNPVTFAACGGR